MLGFGEPPAGATPQQATETVPPSTPAATENQDNETLQPPKKGLAERLQAVRAESDLVEDEARESLAKILKDIRGVMEIVATTLPIDPQKSSRDKPRDSALQLPDGRYVRTTTAFGEEFREGIFVGADGEKAKVSLETRGSYDRALDPNDQAAVEKMHDFDKFINIQDPEDPSLTVGMSTMFPGRFYIEQLDKKDDTVFVEKSYRDDKVYMGKLENGGDPLEIARRTIDFATAARLQQAEVPVATATPQPMSTVA